MEARRKTVEDDFASAIQKANAVGLTKDEILEIVKVGLTKDEILEIVKIILEEY